MTTMDKIKYNLMIKGFTFLKVPLLGLSKIKIDEISDERAILRIPFIHRNKNHLGSMYFGAICMGAEASVAVKIVHLIYAKKMPVNFVFKDFQINFLKRAEGDVLFICDQGLAVEALAKKAIDTHERATETFSGYATVNGERVAEYKVSLSLKKKK